MKKPCWSWLIILAVIASISYSIGYDMRISVTYKCESCKLLCRFYLSLHDLGDWMLSRLTICQHVCVCVWLIYTQIFNIPSMYYISMHSTNRSDNDNIMVNALVFSGWMQPTAWKIKILKFCTLKTHPFG